MLVPRRHCSSRLPPFLLLTFTPTGTELHFSFPKSFS